MKISSIIKFNENISLDNMKLFKTIDTSFDKFDDTVRRYLAKTFNNLGLEYTHTQIFGVIFDGMKGIMQNIMFYIEDALTEQNIFTASRKLSIYSLAKSSGYEAYYGSAAVGTLIGKMEINNGLSSKSSKVYIDNRSVVMNKNNYVPYSIILPTSYYVFDVSKPLVSHEFKVVQGIFRRASSIAKGYSLETVHVYSTELFDRQYIEVKVNGETWTEAGNLYDMTEDSHEYVLSIGYENSFDITFGNGIHGKILMEGDTVTIDYLAHQGSTGNVSSIDAYDFKFDSYGYDTLGNRIDINDYMTLTMQNCISGGNNSDTIDFIRKMVGTNSRSLVLVSEDNFKLFFKRFSFIGYVSCWAESNSMCINATCLSNIKENIKDVEDYFSMNINDMILKPYQKEMIINTLENSNKTFAGLTLKFQDPIIRQFAFICYVKIDNVYNKDTAIHSIRSILGNYFLNIDSETLFIAKSDLIAMLVNEIDCITAIDLDIISKYGEDAYYNNTYTKYEFNYVNNSYKYVETTQLYESTVYPGLDAYGNISLDSKLEIPVLHGGFRYYINKKEDRKDQFVNIEDIQVYFI